MGGAGRGRARADRIPGAAQVRQQALDFFEDVDLVLQIGLQQSRAHVFIERVEAFGDLAAGLLVEAGAQAAVDDQDGLGNCRALVWNIARLQVHDGRIDRHQGTVEEHDDELVRAGRSDARFDAYFCIGIDATLLGSEHVCVS